MEEWKEYKLADITIMKNGKKRPNCKGVFPVYGGNGIMDYCGDYNSEATIIVGRVGAYCGCVYLCMDKCWVSDNAISVSNKDSVDLEYLFYAMKTLDFHRQRIGGAQPLMTQDIIGSFDVSLPNISEQRDIVSIIKSLDDKIENNRRINENLEQQAQALFKSWFVDFEPFRDQPFVESELGMIPQGWKVESIYKHIDVIYGAPYKSSLFNEKMKGMPLIRIRDLKTFKPQFYTPEVLPNTEYINAGDVIAGMDAEFIPCIWIGETGVLNQRCCKFKAKDDRISNYYIKYLVLPQLEFVQFYKTGTTVSHLGKSDIDKFKVISPPLEIIISFSEIVNPLLLELKRASNESRRLELLRDSLLPKLMSGEIKV
jgi:type I restriction enzyme S subunit